jgi:hypothetical protein
MILSSVDVIRHPWGLHSVTQFLFTDVIGDQSGLRELLTRGSGTYCLRGGEKIADLLNSDVTIKPFFFVSSFLFFLRTSVSS